MKVKFKFTKMEEEHDLLVIYTNLGEGKFNLPILVLYELDTVISAHSSCRLQELEA